MGDLVLIFEGSSTESQILKHQLDAVGIQCLLKSEAKSAAIAGFGSFGLYQVYVGPNDHEKAAEVVKTFQV